MELFDFELDEEYYQVGKPKIEYCELDDVYFEEIEELNLMDFFADLINRECPPTTSSSIVQPEKIEEPQVQTVSSPPSTPPSTEPET
jgi:hypothetical protein